MLEQDFSRSVRINTSSKFQCLLWFSRNSIQTKIIWIVWCLDMNINILIIFKSNRWRVFSPQITSSNLMSISRGGFQSFSNIFCALQVSFCFNKMFSETAFRIVMLGKVMLLSICRAQLRCRCPPDMSPKDML